MCLLILFTINILGNIMLQVFSFISFSVACCCINNHCLYCASMPPTTGWSFSHMALHHILSLAFYIASYSLFLTSILSCRLPLHEPSLQPYHLAVFFCPDCWSSNSIILAWGGGGYLKRQLSLRTSRSSHILNQIPMSLNSFSKGDTSWLLIGDLMHSNDPYP